MDEPRHNGVAPPIDLAPRKRFTQATGYSAEYRRKILTPTTDAEITNLAIQGFDVEAEPRDGTPFTDLRWTVTDPSSGGGSQDPDRIITDLWEDQDNMLERELWSLPGVIEQLAILKGQPDSYDKAAFVRRLVDDKVAGRENTLDNNGTEVALWPMSIYVGHFTALGLNPEVFTGLVNSMANGVQSYLVKQPVIRRTRILPPNTSIKPLKAQAGKIMSSGFLISFENPPATIKINIESGFYFVRSPNMVQQTDGNWQLRQEWWWTQYFDNFVYEFIG
jgi:hypothetical protein